MAALNALFQLQFDMEQEMPDVHQVQQDLIELANSMVGGGPEPIRHEIIETGGYIFVVNAWSFFCNTGENNVRVLTPEANLIREASLRALYIMSTGFPDIADEFSYVMLVQAFYNLIPEPTKIYALKFMRNICIRNEVNRETLAFEYHIADPFVRLLKVESPSSELVREWCGAFRTFVLGDDPRIVYNRVPERKRLIFQFQAHSYLCQFLNLYTDENTLNAIVIALAQLACTEDYCVSIEAFGGLRGLNSVLEKYSANTNLAKNTILCLRYMFLSPIVRDKGGSYPILKMVLDLAGTNREDVDFVEIALSCLAFITLRNVCTCAQLLVEKGVETVTSLMKIHSDSPQLLKSACLILRNVASVAGKIGRLTILDCSTEAILHDIGEKHIDLIVNHVNPLLKDLGLIVLKPPTPTGDTASSAGGSRGSAGSGASGAGGRRNHHHRKETVTGSAMSAATAPG